MSQIIEELRRELIANSDEQLRESSQHFFKEAIRCYGIKSATVVNIGKEHFKAIKNLPKEDIFNLCNELWQSGIIEESFVACHWSYAVSKKYTSDDLIVFEKWIDTYINNWASCDTLCNHTVGELVEMYPESISGYISTNSPTV